MPKVSIDMQLPLAYVTESLVSELELLEPIGKGNTKPLFAEKYLKLLSPRIIGNNQNVLKFRVQDRQGNQKEAIYFGDAQDCLDYIRQKDEMSFTFYPTVNDYMGKRTLQITVVNYQ